MLLLRGLFVILCRTAIKTYVFPSQTPSNLETEIQAAGASSSAKEASEHEPSSNQMGEIQGLNLDSCRPQSLLLQGLPYELPHSLSPDAAVEQQEAAECCRINPCPTNATTNSHDPGQHALGFAVVITLLSHVLSSAALRTRTEAQLTTHTLSRAEHLIESCTVWNSFPRSSRYFSR